GQRISGNLIQGKSIGIIGLGRIGKRVAEQLSGFAVCIMAADPHKDESWLKGRNIAMVGLEELLGKSDIIILCASGSSCIIKEREFFLMKRGMYLINVSRGAAVEEAALYGAIKEGRLAGAALDVFAKEPYNGPLLELENVILTPHIGSYTEESRAAMEIEAVHNLLNALKNIKGAGNEERRRA
ncbi:MAG: NAD(P)-dependent oxidoreductase, partial [Candidatus Omnitrophota bacterium]